MNKESTIHQKLLAFQKKVGAIKKDSKNPFFKSNYADINTFLGVIKPILSDNGLVIIQPFGIKDGKNIIATIVADEAGNEIRSEIELPVGEDSQKQGSIITYYRRYAIQSLLALEAEDDDGNSVSGNNAPKYKPRPMTGAKVQYPEKMCPDCGITHTGKYPRCINCYKGGSTPVKKTKTLINEEAEPFGSEPYPLGSEDGNSL